MQTNIIKALLILWVVFDHNNYIRELIPQWLGPLSFHVLGFLALPFIFERNSKTTIVDKGVRYMIPHIAFYTAAVIGYQILILGNSDVFNIFKLWGVGAITGSGDHVKDAAGFLMFWFLPCMFSLLLLKTLTDKVWQYHWLLIIVLIPLSYLLLKVPDDIFKSAPLGFLLAVYLLPQCLLLGIFYRLINESKFRVVFSLSLALTAFVMYMNVVDQKLVLEYSRFHVPKDFAEWVLVNLANFTAALAIILFGGMLNVPLNILSQIGKYSLGVYLIHNFVYFIERHIYVFESENIYAVFVFAFCEIILVSIISLLIVKSIFKSNRLKALIFPKDIQEIKQGLRV